MAAKKSPLSGYNHNLKYKNRVYHVQTEDSGRDNPHIFTHLFHDGTILNSIRSEYAEIVETPDWETQLRARMQHQHKDMMKGLIKGSFDDKIVGFFGILEAEVAEELPMATLPPPPKRERSQSSKPAAPPAPPPGAPPPGAQPPAQQPAHQTPWQPPAPNQAPAQGPGANASGVVVAMPMVIVGDATEAAPPPPAPPAQAPPPQPQAPPAQPPSDLGAIFAAVPGEAKNVPDSIFGSELISEKSLDEVILAYLSEDLSEE